MNLGELRIRVKNLTSGKNYMGVAEDSHFNAQINEALRYIGVMLPQFHPAVEVNVASGIYMYPLNEMEKRMMVIDSVSIEGKMLKGFTGKVGGMFSWAELKAYYPSFATASRGKPEAACLAGQNLILVPTPESAYDCTVSGRYIPEPLATDNDVPDIPEFLHECVAVMAAILALYPVSSSGDLLERMKGEYALCYDILNKEIEADGYRHMFGFNRQNETGVI